MKDGKFKTSFGKEVKTENNKKQRKCQGIRKDCFAFADFKGTWKCTALNDLYCSKEDCAFYKPSKDVDFHKMGAAIRNYTNNDRHKPKKGE